MVRVERALGKGGDIDSLMDYRNKVPGLWKGWGRIGLTNWGGRRPLPKF